MVLEHLWLSHVLNWQHSQTPIDTSKRPINHFTSYIPPLRTQKYLPLVVYKLQTLILSTPPPVYLCPIWKNNINSDNRNCAMGNVQSLPPLPPNFASSSHESPLHHVCSLWSLGVKQPYGPSDQLVLPVTFQKKHL